MNSPEDDVLKNRIEIDMILNNLSYLHDWTLSDIWVVVVHVILFQQVLR